MYYFYLKFLLVLPCNSSSIVVGLNQTVTFRDLTLLDIANLCPAVLIMNFLFV